MFPTFLGMYPFYQVFKYIWVQLFVLFCDYILFYDTLYFTIINSINVGLLVFLLFILHLLFWHFLFPSFSFSLIILAKDQANLITFAPNAILLL